MKQGFFVFLLLFTLSFKSFSQNVNGKWYGVGYVDKEGSHNSYLSELILQQNGSNVTGIYNYFFRSSYISSQVKGVYNKVSRELHLSILPVLNYKAKDLNGADCSMSGVFVLKVSKIETSLSGSFQATPEYKYTCPDIVVRLKKFTGVETIEKVQEEEDEQKEIVEVEKPVVKNQPDTLLQLLNSRTTDVMNVIEVDSDTLYASLYDNSEVDYDTVTIFYNKKVIAYKNMLSDKPIKLKLPVDTSINEISMFADNLGQLPPNTGLLIVMDGDKRYELRMVSNFIKNGAVRFRKRKQAATNTKL